MISDNGGEFTSSWSSLIDEQYGSKHITITPYNPQANGKCETVNQTIKNMLNNSVIDGENCERLLPSGLFVYNTAKHASTKYSPFCLMYWINPILPNEQCTGEIPFFPTNNVLEKSHSTQRTMYWRNPILPNEQCTGDIPFYPTNNVLEKSHSTQRSMYLRNPILPNEQCTGEIPFYPTNNVLEKSHSTQRTMYWRNPILPN